MRKIKSENIAEKSKERTVPPGGGPSFRRILLAEQEMFFQIYFIQNVFRRVDYSTKFLWNPLKIKGFQTPDQKFDGK
ncbi:hypothetical protein DW708_04645 [Ruminococcus sp. AM27-11LB]|nr:hypothetical protein DW719_05195 [Ruminococcus sp. AM27-27]RGH96836.1 hypothetical protein DW708_04645 [Ruminococcus sp. AM27-11LB]